MGFRYKAGFYIDGILYRRILCRRDFYVGGFLYRRDFLIGGFFL